MKWDRHQSTMSQTETWRCTATDEPKMLQSLAIEISKEEEESGDDLMLIAILPAGYDEETHSPKYEALIERGFHS